MHGVVGVELESLGTLWAFWPTEQGLPGHVGRHGPDDVGLPLARIQ